MPNWAFGDGFEHYDDVTLKWSAVTGTGAAEPEIISNIGRNSGGGLRCNGQSGAPGSNVLRSVPNEPSLYVHFACKPPLGFTGRNYVLQFLDSGSVQCWMQINADGSIAAYRAAEGLGSELLLGTASQGATIGKWNHFQVAVTINQTTGVFLIKKNGTTILNVTGADTRATSNSQITSVKLGSCDNFVNGDWDFDDFLMNNVALWGDIRAISKPPTADGTYSDFTPSTGSDNFAMVDENPPNESDWNESSTAGHKDSFDKAALGPASGTVYFIGHNIFCRKTDAGSRKVAGLYYDGSDALGDEVAVGDDWQILQSSYIPASPLDVTDFDAAEVGYKLTE